MGLLLLTASLTGCSRPLQVTCVVPAPVATPEPWRAIPMPMPGESIVLPRDPFGMTSSCFMTNPPTCWITPNEGWTFSPSPSPEAR